ncbi:MAG: hypothetical protein U0930_13685 [Pirellulales bacterium]
MMRSQSQLAFGLAIVLGSLFNCTTASGGEPDKVARAKVTEGIKQFSSGNFTEAVNAFSEAAEVEPENSIIKFDKACALMASGNDSSARELLLQSALSKDVQVASAAYYNLACIAVKQGRASLGDNPLEANKEARDKSIERLQAADAHFRDCLRIDPFYKDARYNLELLRNFVNHLQSQWKKIDHQRELEQKDLFELLQQLDDQQAALRQSSRRLSTQAGGKPPRFERQKLAANQTALSHDASLLEGRIQQVLNGGNSSQDPSHNQPANSSGDNDPVDETTRKISELLQKIVAQTSQEMKSAADNISASNWSTSLQAQRSALDHLREIYALLQELPGLLNREIAIQEALIALHDPKAISSGNEQAENFNATRRKNEQVDDSSDGQAWQQQWITLFTQALTAKARAMQQSIPNDESAIDVEKPSSENLNLEPENQKRTKAEREGPDDSLASSVSELQTDVDQAAAEKKQIEQLRKSLGKILQKSPEIIDLSRQASEQLSTKQFEAAKINQVEILKLLKELAESLPKQPPQNSKDNQQNDQKNKNQDKKNDQKNQDKNNDDKKQDQDQKSQDDQNQQKSERKNSDQQNPNQQDQQKDNNDNNNNDPEKNSDPKEQENKDGSKQQSDSPDKSDSKSQENLPEEKDANKPDEKQSQKDQDKPDNKQQPEKPEDKQSGSKSDETKAEEKSDHASASSAENANATDAQRQQQAQQMAEQRAQVILRRIREREAKYRELLQQLRELQGKRSPVDKDW